MDVTLNTDYSKQFPINLFIALSHRINLLTLIACKILCHLNAEQFILDNVMWK